MQVYSNVFVHEETGDVLGYDLALKRKGDLGFSSGVRGIQPDRAHTLLLGKGWTQQDLRA